MICCGSPSAGFIVPREARMKTSSALRVLAVAVMACCFLPFCPGPAARDLRMEHSLTGCRRNGSRWGAVGSRADCRVRSDWQFLCKFVSFIISE